MSSRWFARISGLGLALLLTVVAIALAISASRNATADPAIDADEAAFLTWINDYRATKSLPPLVIDTRMTRASDWLATDMANKDL